MSDFSNIFKAIYGEPEPQQDIFNSEDNFNYQEYFDQIENGGKSFIKFHSYQSLKDESPADFELWLQKDEEWVEELLNETSLFEEPLKVPSFDNKLKEESTNLSNFEQNIQLIRNSDGGHKIKQEYLDDQNSKIPDKIHVEESKEVKKDLKVINSEAKGNSKTRGKIIERKFKRWGRKDDIRLISKLQIIWERESIPVSSFLRNFSLNREYSSILYEAKSMARWKGDLKKLKERVKKLADNQMLSHRQLKLFNKLWKAKILTDSTIDMKELIKRFPGKLECTLQDALNEYLGRKNNLKNIYQGIVRKVENL